MNSLTVVSPFHNESAHVAPFLARLTSVLGQMDVAWTVLCVNDGSTDDTLALLLAAHEGEARIKVIDHSRAEAVVLINSDLQHPPELLPAMLAKFREGYEDVYMVPRRLGDSGLAD